jgi:hypothetical protein
MPQGTTAGNSRGGIAASGTGVFKFFARLTDKQY